ncbi:MAG TPA: hypothetical protein VFV02_11980 [Acidimicrobiales bacterium]|nr:hypothetical protein [Acidimicrobiales bacterium]
MRMMRLVRATMRHGDSPGRGSVLALVPAGFLIFVILGALAVDSAVAYQGQQQLHDSLVAAANDAASAAVDRSVFYATGTVVLNATEAGQIVCQSVASQHSAQLHGTRLWMAVQGTTVRLVGESTVYAVFGKAIPGFGERRVRSSVEALAATGPGQRPPATATSDTPIPLSCS